MSFTHNDPGSALDAAAFEQTIEGKEARLYRLSNGKGLHVAITNYGARLVALYTRDRDGAWRDVVLGFDKLQGYLDDGDYHGAIVGRYANRIARGRFSLEGRDYTLAINNAPNHLHGGKKGFNAAVWDVVSASERELVLQYISPDGEEGYPGTLSLTVHYRLADDDRLEIHFLANTDAATVLNVTNHAYWNLNGQGSGPVLEHELFINAGHFTPVDETLIPTGDLAFVTGTPFDFTKPEKIGARINDDNPQLVHGAGYDHNFVLMDTGEELMLAAAATGDQSGIRMAVYTTEPGIQLYTGNFLQSLHTLKYGLTDERRSAFCLETQHFPDSPNQPGFPSVLLRPGQVFQSRTDFVFPGAAK
ncbi:aldose epimerase family protein [Flaviaesturariibacter amylovorans]|uniref:Aldose 1-epimerase n=1 Tax=Flaviaesturariibacter amylovorans TaxID=1084520 RepID=A0ABP8GU60_9BACT